VFDIIDVAVQDLKRNLGDRREVLVSHVQGTPIDSAGHHSVKNKVWLVVLYSSAESSFGRDLGSKVGNHDFCIGRRAA
jgi:hypothetical protein